jgi:hypothetical protein
MLGGAMFFACAVFRNVILASCGDRTRLSGGNSHRTSEGDGGGRKCTDELHVLKLLMKVGLVSFLAWRGPITRKDSFH